MMTLDHTPSHFIRRGYVIMWMALLMGAFAAINASADDAVTLTIETEGSYTMVAGDSLQLVRELPVFYAVRKAAEMAADQFEQQGLIQFADRDKNELVNLVADNLSTELIDDQCVGDSNTATCTVRARTVVMLSDFIDAQLISIRLGAQEDKEDYRHEMEPQLQVSKDYENAT